LTHPVRAYALLLWVDPQGSELCGQTLSALILLLRPLVCLLGALAFLLGALAFLLRASVCLHSALLFLLMRRQNPGPTGIIAA
jgi:hypothetical protein